MKNTYIIIIVLILIVVGFLVFGGNKSEAPTDIATTGDEMPNDNELVDPAPSPSGAGLDVSTDITLGTVKEFTVEAKNFSFAPSTMTVKKGDKVKINFKNTGGFHDFKIDGYGVATKQAQAPATEVLEFTADKAGSFEYYCSVGEHRKMGMKGSFVVTE